MSELIVSKIVPANSAPLIIGGSRAVKLEHLIDVSGAEVSILELYQFTQQLERHDYVVESTTLSTTWSDIATNIQWSTGSYVVQVKCVDLNNKISMSTATISFVSPGDMTYASTRVVDLDHTGESTLVPKLQIVSFDNISLPNKLQVASTLTQTELSRLEVTVRRIL